ncbi:MAG: glycosyltransferase [Coriobacteriia bacterium]|nr:glycosyltransferase [Coriobacteriia bacterium]
MSLVERTPAISVIVPVYNVERYLPACLDSLLVQSFDYFEILIIDDGSTDDSAALLARYAEDHPTRIRTFSKPNGGLGDARNFGIDRARGEYLSFVDSDDTVEPTMLQELHACAQNSDSELVLCGIRSFADRTFEPYLPEPDMSVFGNSFAEEPRLLYRVDASACDKLYSRDLFVRTGIRFPVGLAFEDLPTVYSLLPAANRVEKVDRPLYNYRQHREGSISSAYGDRYLELVEGFRRLVAHYKGEGLFERNADALLRLHLTHLIAGRYPDLFLRADDRARSGFIREVFGVLDGAFPGWRTSRVCRDLWPSPTLRFVSTHGAALGWYARLPERAYLGILRRLGAFDPLR